MTESNRIEYKRELTDSLEREVVAFLNAGEGGTVTIGMDRDGGIYGVEACDQTQLVIKDRLKNNIQPSIMGLFEILHETHDGKDILRVTIAGGLEKPYFLKKYGMTEKGCFLRIGSACEPMPKEMIESLYGKRVRNTIGRMESPRRDLTFAQLKIYYDARGLKLNASFMRNLELLTPDGQSNYAAYLLADENGSSLQVAKYAGEDRVDLIENRDYGRCSLVKALKSVLDRVDVENTVFTKIGYPLREERELIDSTAMREAIINAVVHNDYSYGAVPKVEFYTDRAEVTSMGGLPYGVTEADFFGGCSVPRNKEIMRVFRDLEIVEHLGSGVPRILKAYGKEAFEIRDSYLRIIFRYKGAAEKSEKSEGTAQEAAPEVTPEVRKLISAMDGEHSRAEIQEMMGLKDAEHFRKSYLNPAVEAGLVELTIPEKPRSPSQRYRLADKGRRVKKMLEGKEAAS
jgi:predicted HTH transcriptional regulator